MQNPREDGVRALQSAKDLLAAWAGAFQTPEPNRLDVLMAASDLPAAARALQAANWGYLSAITGLDPGAASGNLEVLYHYCAGAAVVTLRVSLPRAGASVPSLCALLPAAVLFERELSEMFGITVVDIPDASRLFLPDDWPAGIYPLRKDFVVADGVKPQDAG